MRITNQNQTPVPNTETSLGAAAASGNDAAAPTTPPLSSPAQDSSLVPSFELRSLTAALQQLPSIRDDAVAATTGRLAAGELRSPSALEATAQAILEQ